ncbi:MAG: hypothetical protein HC913_03875 [Microscillaceae bacterium]|nr:hypothetical protein [Microscillaceae bacterium]
MKKELSDKQLEDFIRQHREDLQHQFVPSPGLWNKLEKELHPKAPRLITIRYTHLRNLAAFVLLCLAIGLGLWWSKSAPSENAPSLSLAALHPHLAEAEQYYSRVIAEKRAKINHYPLEQMGLYDEFQGDLNELDEMYRQLKTELLQGPAPESVQDAMIQNLQMRLRVLNQQLEVLEKMKDYQKSIPHEKQIF